MRLQRHFGIRVVVEDAPQVDVAAWTAALRGLRDRAPVIFPEEAIPTHFKRAAVLAVFWEDEGSLRILLTRRASTMSRHAGQTAFPGGLVEVGETYAEAAVREAHEEVGLAPAAIEVVGRLDDAWSGAGSLLVPYVALARTRPSLTANPAEVDEILTPDVRDLLRPDARTTETVEQRGVTYVNDTITFPGGSVYGLTADILSEALERGQGVASNRGAGRLRDLITYHQE